MSFFSMPSKNSAKKPGNSAKEHKTLPADYIPKRFGLKYEPPTIILEYMLQNTGKLYHHKMRLPTNRESAKASELLEILKKKHGNYLINPITDEQILALIDKLLNNPRISSKKPSNLPSFPSKLSKLEPLSMKTPANPQKTGDFFEKKQANPGNWGSEELYADDFEEDLNEMDLNKLDNEELSKKKAKMDVLFNKNQKKPTDPGFKYDVQEDFEPKYENDWDLDDDEDIV